MSRLIEPSAREEKAWHRWVAKRPPHIREVAERFDPWSLYQLKTTGQRVTVVSFSEEKKTGKVTMTVSITGQFNLIMFDREVFGIDPADLELCDPPPETEMLGTIMGSDQVEQNRDFLHVLMRPGLFVLEEDSKAVRKQ